MATGTRAGTKVRVGVIGAGAWAVSSHLPTLQQRADEVEFTAVCRVGQEALERIREQYGFRVASEDYHEVLSAGCDVVVVSSPSGLHHEHAKAALEAGAHVLCEKPVTIDPADAWDLVETARRVDRELFISFGWNYLPMLREAKRLMDEIGIGTLEHMTVHMASVTRELLADRGGYSHHLGDSVPDPETWTDASKSGGGYGQAQLSHALGMALWLTGARAESAFAVMSAPLGARVELHDAITMTYEGGAIGVLAGASCHRAFDRNKHQLEMRAVGSEGQFHIDLAADVLWIYRPDEVDLKVDLPPDAGFYHDEGPIHALVDAGLGKPIDNQSPGELGARTVEALELAYRSAASGVREYRS